MSTKSYHLAQSVVGALLNWKDKDWVNVCKDDNGNWMTPSQVKKEFKRLQKEGIDLIPMGECDNFDPKKGCLGHDE
jgi:hypothetical protein